MCHLEVKRLPQIILFDPAALCHFFFFFFKRNTPSGFSEQTCRTGRPSCTHYISHNQPWYQSTLIQQGHVKVWSDKMGRNRIVLKFSLPSWNCNCPQVPLHTLIALTCKSHVLKPKLKTAEPLLLTPSAWHCDALRAHKQHIQHIQIVTSRQRGKNLP